MGTNCAPLVIADLYLYSVCYERDFLLSLDSQCLAGVTNAFNDTSRYLDDIFNIYMNNYFFNTMVPTIYPKELTLNKANTSDTSAAFLDLDLSIENGVKSTKNMIKRTILNLAL